MFIASSYGFSFVMTIPALLAIASTTLCAAEGRAYEEDKEDRFWAFGDSFSDNGNLSLLFATDGIDNTFLPPEAYVPFYPLAKELPLQRISTGPTIAEYTAECYGSVLLPSGSESWLPNGPLAANNFAIFAARATANVPGLDLPYQIATFAQRLIEMGVDVSHDRALVFIGANDIFQAFEASIAPISAGGKEADFEAGRVVLDVTLASIRSYVFGDGGLVTLPGGTQVPVPSLAMLGISKFIMSSIPNLKFTPAAIQTAELLQCDNVLKAADELSEYFNEGLDAVVADMKANRFHVVFLDTAQEFAKIRRDFKKLGFTNREDDCFLVNLLNTLTNGNPPTPGVFRDTCSAETTEDFLFLDSVHPTGAVHALLADELLDDLPCVNGNYAKGGSGRSSKKNKQKGNKKTMKMLMKMTKAKYYGGKH